MECFLEYLGKKTFSLQIAPLPPKKVCGGGRIVIANCTRNVGYIQKTQIRNHKEKTAPGMWTILRPVFSIFGWVQERSIKTYSPFTQLSSSQIVCRIVCFQKLLKTVFREGSGGKEKKPILKIKFVFFFLPFFVNLNACPFRRERVKMFSILIYVKGKKFF